MTLHSSADSLQAALLEACTRPCSVADLAQEWGMDLELLKIHVEHLVSMGILARVGQQRVVVPSEETGIGYLASSGVGRFNVVPDDPNLPLMKVRQEFLNGALPGDHVLFHVVRRSKGKQYGALNISARIMSILKERPTEVVGVYERSNNSRGALRLNGRNKPRHCMLLDGPPELRPGQLVRVSLPRAQGGSGFEGRFIEIVADIEAADNDTISICELMDLPMTFPEEVIAAAKLLPKNPSKADFVGRQDFRDLLTITIDPADAKDHDDAISVEQLADGLIRVGVHIADVSAYVTPDSVFDIEASERGSSTYLPGHTVPMLPHELSAGLCSLKEGVDRLAKSCFFIVDKKGELIRRELYKSIVRVDRFFNYEEIFSAMEGRTELESPFKEILPLARTAAKRMRKLRMDNGSIVLSIDRPHLRIGNNGEVIEVTSDRQNESNQLVEDCMLAANSVVAGFMLDRKMPYIGRLHPAPQPSAEEEFADFCTKLGVGAPSFQDPRAIQLFLDGLEGREGKAAIHLAVLKSMMRASYQDKAGLHYALGFHEYTHFTSPIRRLCDVTVHQILDRYFEAGGSLKSATKKLDLPWMDGSKASELGKKVDGSRIRDASTWHITLKSIAQRANDTERRSSKAEMRAVQLKLLRTMQDRIGEHFEGTVVHITNAGIIFQLDEVMAEGTLFFRDLCDEYVTPKKFWVTYRGPKGETSVKVGDRLEVEVAEVDLASQTMKLLMPGSGALGGSTDFVDHRKKHSSGSNSRGKKQGFREAPKKARSGKKPGDKKAKKPHRGKR